MNLRFLLPFTLPLLLAACDSQVDPDYPGEPLATIPGTIVNELDSVPPGPINAVLVWNNGTDNLNDAENFPAKATAMGSFPAARQALECSGGRARRRRPTLQRLAAPASAPRGLGPPHKRAGPRANREAPRSAPAADGRG